MPRLYQHRLSAQLPSPVVVSVPHAGLHVPALRSELMQLPQALFLGDVDFEIHGMWQELCTQADISFFKAETHRYVLDLNRAPSDIDSASVAGNATPKGTHPKGLFWTVSTRGESLGPHGKAFKPLSAALAQQLIAEVWKPYYAALEAELQRVRDKFGFAILVDGHSMPSRGSVLHSDSGETRADIVPSDRDGKSADARVLQCALKVGQQLGFAVSPNHPYKGGNITGHFGKPTQGVHALQIEINRKLYMNEEKFSLLPDAFKKLSRFSAQLLQELSALRL